MTSEKNVAQQPLILRYHRLMDAFAKSDDERDFYLNKTEGFIVFVNLSKSQKELDLLTKEISNNKDEYFIIPKLSYYESKKIMEGFVNEKVYDIDSKEKLTDIIQSKDAREHFLEYVYDHHNELEKWQQYYHDRSRIRIIEWLRANKFNFVFEEDLELSKSIIANLKNNLFQTKIPKNLITHRNTIRTKAKMYYSSEALNPRPKRGRPPKQITKSESEPEYTEDIYLTTKPHIRPFLYVPDITNVTSITFSSRFTSEEEFLANMKSNIRSQANQELENLTKKLATLQDLSYKLEIIDSEKNKKPSKSAKFSKKEDKSLQKRSKENSKPATKRSKKQKEDSKELKKETKKQKKESKESKKETKKVKKTPKKSTKK